MSETFLEHVLKAVEHLKEEVAGLGLTETSTQSNEIEELASAYKLKYDVLDLFGTLLWVSLESLVDFEKLDNVGMVKVGECAHFILN